MAKGAKKSNVNSKIRDDVKKFLVDSKIDIADDKLDKAITAILAQIRMGKVSAIQQAIDSHFKITDRAEQYNLAKIINNNQDITGWNKEEVESSKKDDFSSSDLLHVISSLVKDSAREQEEFKSAVPESFISDLQTALSGITKDNAMTKIRAACKIMAADNIGIVDKAKQLRVVELVSGVKSYELLDSKQLDELLAEKAAPSEEKSVPSLEDSVKAVFAKYHKSMPDNFIDDVKKRFSEDNFIQSDEAGRLAIVNEFRRMLTPPNGAISNRNEQTALIEMIMGKKIDELIGRKREVSKPRVDKEPSIEQKVAQILRGLEYDNLPKDFISNLQDKLQGIDKSNAIDKIKDVCNFMSTNGIGIKPVAQDLLIKTITGKDVESWAGMKIEELVKPKTVETVEKPEKSEKSETTVNAVDEQVKVVFGKKPIPENFMENMRAELKDIDQTNASAKVKAVRDIMSAAGISDVEDQNMVIELITARKIDDLVVMSRKNTEVSPFVQVKTPQPLSRDEQIKAFLKMHGIKVAGPILFKEILPELKKLVNTLVNSRKQEDIDKIQSFLCEKVGLPLSKDLHLEFIGIVMGDSLENMINKGSRISLQSIGVNEKSSARPHSIARQTLNSAIDTNVLDVILDIHKDGKKNVEAAKTSGGKWMARLTSGFKYVAIPTLLLSAKATRGVVRYVGKKLVEEMNADDRTQLRVLRTLVRKKDEALRKSLQCKRSDIVAKANELGVDPTNPIFVKYLSSQNRNLDTLEMDDFIVDLSDECVAVNNNRDNTFIQLMSNELYGKLKTHLGENADIAGALRKRIKFIDGDKKVVVEGKVIEIDSDEASSLKGLVSYFQLDSMAQLDLFEAMELKDGKITFKSGFDIQQLPDEVQSMISSLENIDVEVFKAYGKYSQQESLLVNMVEELAIRSSIQENEKIKSEITRRYNEIGNRTGVRATIKGKYDTGTFVEQATQVVETAQEQTITGGLVIVDASNLALLNTAREKLQVTLKENSEPGKDKESMFRE